MLPLDSSTHFIVLPHNQLGGKIIQVTQANIGFEQATTTFTFRLKKTPGK